MPRFKISMRFCRIGKTVTLADVYFHGAFAHHVEHGIRGHQQIIAFGDIGGQRRAGEIQGPVFLQCCRFHRRRRTRGGAK
jgi:hypothetical protein